MINRLEEAKYVLVVCTETYHRRFNRQEEPDVGKGGVWEGAVITQALYDGSAFNTKFVPVLFAKSDTKHIPIILKGATYYVLPDDFTGLYGHLTEQTLFEEIPLGDVLAISPKKPPDTDWLTAKLNVPTAIQFGWEDLRDVIIAFHGVLKISNNSSDSKEDFFIVELEQKNTLNGMGRPTPSLL